MHSSLTDPHVHGILFFKNCITLVVALFSQYSVRRLNLTFYIGVNKNILIPFFFFKVIIIFFSLVNLIKLILVVIQVGQWSMVNQFNTCPLIFSQISFKFISPDSPLQNVMINFIQPISFKYILKTRYYIYRCIIKMEIYNYPKTRFYLIYASLNVE